MPPQCCKSIKSVRKFNFRVLDAITQGALRKALFSLRKFIDLEHKEYDDKKALNNSNVANLKQTLIDKGLGVEE